MNDFDLILEDCLERLSSGVSSLDECLLRHPEYAHQLRPLLQTATRLEQVSNVQPSPGFKRRSRAQLIAHMQAHPHGRQGVSPFLRLAFSMAFLVLAFLVTGTALAQSALPDEPLYNWKLTSEYAWRAFSPDPLGVDLALADRRVAELVALADDPRRSVLALEAYREVLNRLMAGIEAGGKNRILPVLQAHQFTLMQAGLSVPELDLHVGEQSMPETDPTTPAPPTSTPIVETPVLPEIIPTLKGPGLPLPTIEIPPPIQ